MLKNFALLTIGLITFSMTQVKAQTQVTQGVMNGKKYGVTYLLPKSQLVVTLHTTKHNYEPGRFCRYADRYLRLGNVKQEASTYWTLDKTNVKSIGVPDKESVFFVEMKDRTTAPLMELTRDGVVRSINLPFEGEKPQAVPAPVTHKELPAPETFLTEEILMAGSTAKMAELIAKEIYSIRDSRNALLRGEADNMPKDGAQLQIMLDNLNDQERSLLQLFQGKETQTEQEFTLTIEPEEAKNMITCRFSKTYGIVGKEDLSGAPLYLSINNQNIIEAVSEQSADGKENKSVLNGILGGNKKGELEGVAYNVPGKAIVSITFQHKEIFKSELAITQFGTREYLANQLFNKNATTKVRFDTQTGGILKIDRGESN